MDLYDALGMEALRAGFLDHTRKAYALLGELDRPRILDVGCGTGLPTIEIARLSHGEIIAIDTDEQALGELRRRVEREGLARRVVAVKASLYDTCFPDESFGVVWEEGVLHLLEPTRSLAQCHRLLAPRGFLIMHETVTWLEEARDLLRSSGFEPEDRYLMPRLCWWTDYYAPLEARIRKLRDAMGDEIDCPELAQYEREISMVKKDPGRFHCGFFLFRKT